MRDDDQRSGHLFSYLSLEQRVPAYHPLRTIRQMTDEALRQLSPQFEAIYALGVTDPAYFLRCNSTLKLARAFTCKMPMPSMPPSPERPVTGDFLKARLTDQPLTESLEAGGR